MQGLALQDLPVLEFIREPLRLASVGLRVALVGLVTAPQGFTGLGVDKL